MHEKNTVQLVEQLDCKLDKIIQLLENQKKTQSCNITINGLNKALSEAMTSDDHIL